MSNLKLPYEKPGLQHWPAADLDAIEAAMSGGGRSGTGFGFYYVWDQEPCVSDTASVSLAGLVASVIVGIIVAAATKNGAAARVFAGVVAEQVANAIINAGIETVYYRSYEYLLRALHMPVDRHALDSAIQILQERDSSPRFPWRAMKA